ncbi:right-handed parallel beta-helix repeat-containing protein [Dactylosporangium sucinum]|uniref:Right handed beta helix domain-containing protein n=1 Tax=Dactylosporangium sucinum TaxID=1424081 RepID=A0A917X6I5_9ACTN|nr:right-handed parallel beta-helix repeat-containing protein [Dactylosporangium sucinum]GGM74952.1 hypothetical protein GCM10007977_090670 [Dactylosporangium sucinum]
MTTEGDLPTTPRHLDWRALPWAPIGVATAGVVTIALTSVLLYPVIVPSADERALGGTPESRRSAGMAGLPGTAGSSAPASPSASPSGSASASPKTTPKSVERTGKPSAGNTGVIPGTRLTVVTGDQTYSADNQVVENADIRGFVRITGKKVTIRNSVIRGGAARCGGVVQVEGAGSATLEDVEIAPASAGDCLDGVWASATNLTRVNIHGVVNGVKATGNDVVLQDSWVHDLGGGPAIRDAVVALGKRRITLRHNVLDAGRDSNAALQVTQEGGASGDLRVEGNWLDGGACTLNFAHRGGGAATLTGITVVNNRFGRASKYVCPILISTQTTLTQNAGNVWDDTGVPIPAPDRHD